MRLPRMPEWEQDLEKEWRWLPKLAPHLSLRVPEPVAKGEPAGSYPFAWAIYRWIAGEPYRETNPAFVALAKRTVEEVVAG